jgi:solute carrier family 25 (mitochondrial carnitine/acylcarnitine transporter), member 20/29
MNRSNKQQRQRDVRNSLIAGSCSGVVSTFALYPLEFVRVQLQQNAQRTMVDICKEALQRPALLYTGLSLPLAAQTVYKAVVFSVTTSTEQWILQYRQTRRQQERRRDEPGSDDDDGAVTLTRMDRFYSGCVGGAVNAGLFVTPVEFVRNQQIMAQQQQQHHDFGKNHHRSSSNSNSSIRQVIRYHVQNGGGIRALWRGVGMTVARDAIGCGAFFYTVHYLQETLANDPRTSTTVSPTVRTLLSGAVAGVMYWVAALPLDTVKTWIQSSDPPHNQNVARTELGKIYRTSGSWGVVQRLLRGWQVTYTRAMPSAALTMITYNSVYQFLNDDGSAATLPI